MSGSESNNNDKKVREARDRAEACGLVSEINLLMKNIPVRWAKVAEKSRRLLKLSKRWEE